MALVKAGPKRTAASPPDPAGRLTIRSYRNYGSTATEELVREVPVYQDEQTVGFTDEDRVSAIDGQGTAVQIEVEHLECRSDLKLANLAVLVREEYSQQMDDSATE